MTKTPEAIASEATAAPSAIAKHAQQAARQPWRHPVTFLALLLSCALSGALTRLLWAPGTGTAVLVTAAETAAGTALAYRAVRPRRSAATAVPPPGTWVPGQSPAGILPDGTASEISKALAGLRSRRFPNGAWVEAFPCADPVRHGLCRTAGSAPDAKAGALRIAVGEHLAPHPLAAAAAVAHEARHVQGWTFLLYCAAMNARLSAWGLAGWVLPWPGMLVALAGIQAGYAVCAWVFELGCDLGAARVTGRATALAGTGYLRQVTREGKRSRPAWQRYSLRLLDMLAAAFPHPPVWARALAIRMAVPR
jgi:hypothetical protein